MYTRHTLRIVNFKNINPTSYNITSSTSIIRPFSLSIKSNASQSYIVAVEDTLHDLENKFELLEEQEDLSDEYNVQLSDGVLTVEFPKLGTYVINKQAPNKQLWLSSPVSGPKRFDLSESGKWVDHRDSSIVLEGLLQKELKENFGFELVED